MPMIAEITHHGRTFRVDLSKPIDLSLPLRDGEGQVRAWCVDPVTHGTGAQRRHHLRREGRRTGEFPHDHLQPARARHAHRERWPHQSREIHPVGEQLKRYFFTAQVVSLLPEERRAPDANRTDLVITLEQLRNVVDERPPEALVIRTLPNDEGGPEGLERHQPTLPAKHGLCLAAQHRREAPAAGPAQRGPRRGWWCAGRAPRLLGFPEHRGPGTHHQRDAPRAGRRCATASYLLELQLPHFMNDAAPSRPVLYALLP